MLASERQIIILKKLEKSGVVYLKQLSEELHASICTIRRDFEKLEKENKCRRVHGGAVRVKFNNRLYESTDIHMDNRMDMVPEIKRRLCRKSAELVEENDCIFIDGGTTFMYMCEYLEGKSVTIVTHSDLIRAKDDSTLSIFVIGGENSSFYKMNLGPLAIKGLHSFNFDKAFIGCAGMSIENLNVFTSEVGTAQIKEEAIKKSQEVYLVMDSSKLNIYGFYSFAGLDSFNGLITEEISDALNTDAALIIADEE